MKKFFAKVWELIKDDWQKSLKTLAIVVPLGIVTYLGYKYVKDSDSFLEKKDVDKAKEKIKAAKDSALASKDVRAKATTEVMKVQAKSKVRLSDYDKSNHNVEDLEIITGELEKDLIERKASTSSFLKKRNNEKYN